MKNKTQEHKRGVFLGVGFLVALSMAITSFEWESKVDFEPITSERIESGTIELVPIVEIPPPQPPKPVIPTTITETEEPIDEMDIPILTIDLTDDPVVDLGPIENPDPEPKAPDFVDFADVMPEPENGYSTFYKALGEEINYPRAARNMNVEGKVFVQFIIGNDGQMKDVVVVKGIGAGCDEEAVRALKKVANWKPGKQRGVPVNVRMIIPITFTLN